MRTLYLLLFFICLSNISRADSIATERKYSSYEQMQQVADSMHQAANAKNIAQLQLDLQQRQQRNLRGAIVRVSIGVGMLVFLIFMLKKRGKEIMRKKSSRE